MPNAPIIHHDFIVGPVIPPTTSPDLPPLVVEDLVIEEYPFVESIINLLQSLAKIVEEASIPSRMVQCMSSTTSSVSLAGQLEDGKIARDPSLIPETDHSPLVVPPLNQGLSSLGSSGASSSGCMTSADEDLVDFIGRNGLMNLELLGQKFTWSNLRKGKDLIQAKLDRFLISGNWGIGPALKLTTLPRMVSDHNPLLLWNTTNAARRKYHFRYEIMWNSHPEFKDCIKIWWRTNIYGTPMFKIARKLDLVKRNVWGWNKYTFGDIFKQKRSSTVN
ncbi:hypothetical protein SUGI_0251310 [Cryptomeria japonica]|nr:hypothetical protein SUGI_0251310 [Cryptomeria japonica]